MIPMKFDTPNNACISLRIIAEKIRAGDITVTTGTVTHEAFDDNGGLLVDIALQLRVPGARRAGN